MREKMVVNQLGALREISSEDLTQVTGGSSALQCGLAVVGGYYAGGTAGAASLGGVGVKAGGLKGAVIGGVIGWVSGAIGGAATAASQMCFDD